MQQRKIDGVKPHDTLHYLQMHWHQRWKQIFVHSYRVCPIPSGGQRGLLQKQTRPKNGPLLHVLSYSEESFFLLWISSIDELRMIENVFPNFSVIHQSEYCSRTYAALNCSIPLTCGSVSIIYPIHHLVPDIWSS